VSEVISSKDAPQAVGPYSQAIKIDDLVFCSGQVGLDPGTGEMVAGGIAEQTGRVLDNLSAVLQAAGLTLGDVVKTTVFLTNIDHFSQMNEVYAGYFGEEPPARSTFAVAALPLGALVEIEAVAAIPPERARPLTA
jgi:2-iminobutanoate/2-iminopropanoate deaminase